MVKTKFPDVKAHTPKWEQVLLQSEPPHACLAYCASLKILFSA